MAKIRIGQEYEIANMVEYLNNSTVKEWTFLLYLLIWLGELFNIKF